MNSENILRTVVYHFMVNSEMLDEISQLIRRLSIRDDGANINDKTTVCSWTRLQMQMDFESVRLTDINACPVGSGLEYI